jgi:hypothetical protein
VRQKVSILAVLLPLLGSCGQDAGPDVHGLLYFASGNYVGEFDVESGTSIAIANRGAVTINRIAPFGAEGLLLAEVANVEGREVPRISWLEPGSGRSGTLYSGVAARYLPAHRALVWDDGKQLRVSSRVRDPAIGAEVMTHNRNQLSAIVDVDDDSVLFEIGSPGQGEVYAYNVVTRELEARAGLAAACRLAGSVWISDREQLACPSRAPAGASTGYLLVDLDGTIRGSLALPAGRHFVALAYAADQHTLFLSEHWQSFLGGVERFGVWAYDLVDGRSYRLVRDQYLGESAVFVER